MVALVIIMTINQQTTAPAKHSCKISKTKASYNMNFHTIRKKTRNELSNIELSTSESYQRGFMPFIHTVSQHRLCGIFAFIFFISVSANVQAVWFFLICFSNIYIIVTSLDFRGRRGRDRMIVGFITTYITSSSEVYSIPTYMIVCQ